MFLVHLLLANCMSVVRQVEHFVAARHVFFSSEEVQREGAALSPDRFGKAAGFVTAANIFPLYPG